MVEGVVNANYEAVITLPVRGPAGLEREIDGVVDTGYNGFLTLPSAIVTEMGLAFQSRRKALLANGAEETFDVYDVTVLWNGQPRYVDTYVAEATPLVGMSLLDSYSLYVEVADGGRVIIEPRG